MGIVIKKRGITSKNNYNIQDGGSKKYKPSIKSKVVSKFLGAKKSLGKITAPINSYFARRKERKASLNYAKQLIPGSVTKKWYSFSKLNKGSKFKFDPTDTINKITKKIDKVKLNPFELQKAQRALKVINESHNKQLQNLTKRIQQNKTLTKEDQIKKYEEEKKVLDNKRVNTSEAKTIIAKQLDVIRSTATIAIEANKKTKEDFIKKKQNYKDKTLELDIIKKQISKSKDFNTLQKLQTERIKLEDYINRIKPSEAEKTEYEKKEKPVNELLTLQALNKSVKYSKKAEAANEIRKLSFGQVYDKTKYESEDLFRANKKKGISSWQTIGQMAKASTTGRILASPAKLARGISRGAQSLRRGASFVSRKLGLNTAGRKLSYLGRKLARATPLRFFVDHGFTSKELKQKLAKSLEESQEINKNMDIVKQNLKNTTEKLSNLYNRTDIEAQIEKRDLQQKKAEYINQYENLKTNSKNLVRSIDYIKKDLDKAVINRTGEVQGNFNKLLGKTGTAQSIEDISSNLKKTDDEGKTLLSKIAVKDIGNIDKLIETMKNSMITIESSDITKSINDIKNINKKIEEAIEADSNKVSNQKKFSGQDILDLRKMQFDLEKHSDNLDDLKYNATKFSNTKASSNIAGLTRSKLKLNTKLASTGILSSGSVSATFKEKTPVDISTTRKNIFVDTLNIKTFDNKIQQIPIYSIKFGQSNTNPVTVIGKDAELSKLTKNNKDSVVLYNIINNFKNKNYEDEIEFIRDIKVMYVKYKIKENELSSTTV